MTSAVGKTLLSRAFPALCIGHHAQAMHYFVGKMNHVTPTYETRCTSHASLTSF